MPDRRPGAHGAVHRPLPEETTKLVHVCCRRHPSAGAAVQPLAACLRITCSRSPWACPACPARRRGVLIAGLAFGVLHNSGGRNPAFAAWASAVGCAYGALLLATGSLACPALAHTLANVASAALWKAGQAEAGKAA